MAVDATRAPTGGMLPVLPPRFALIELALFAGIIAIEVIWEPFPDLTKLNPHPYWIAVLLLSLQYGTVSGLLAAAMAIGGTWLVGLPEPEIGESYFIYFVRVWTQPVLWIVVALLLGSFRMRQIEERDELERQINEVTLRAAAMTGYSTQLKDRVNQLERRLAASARPATEQLLTALGQLGPHGKPEQWADHVHQALQTALPKAQVSIFATEPNGMKLVLAHGWAETAKWRQTFPAAEPLTRAMLTEQRPLSILSVGDERLLAGEGLFAVPLLAPDDGQVVGMLKVEELLADAVNASTIPRLQALARHLVPAQAARAVTTAHVETEPATPRMPLVRRWRPNGAALNGAQANSHAQESPGVPLPRPSVSDRVQ
jgi:polysaccharide biosynthesis protein PelD